MTTNSPDRRKVQKIIRSNVGWNATRERIWNDHELKPPCETMRGLLRIEFRNPRGVVAMISPKGTIQLTYPQALGVDGALEILKPKISTSRDEKLWLEEEREIPLYDEAWDVYDFYEKGHLWHPPFCQACMMKTMTFSIRLKELLRFRFDPVGGIYKWIEDLQRSWFQTAFDFSWLEKAIATDIYEAMLPKNP